MYINTNQLEQMRKNCVERDDIQEEISNFVNRFGGKIRQDFWAAFNTEYSCTHNVMVCVQPDKKVRILSVRKDRIFARHVGELLKSHRIIWASSVMAIPVTWENWQEVFRSLTQEQDMQKYDFCMSAYETRTIKDGLRRESEFYDLATANYYKKLGKRGYNLTFNELRAVRRVEAAERAASKTIAEARRIMENL